MEKELINVYDFDKTIYDGDSTAHFYAYCLLHYPFALIKRWPQLIFYSILFGLNIIKKTPFKEKLYRFLVDIPDIDTAVEGFWKTHRKNIKNWYIKQRKDTDLISSASPYFLVRHMTDELGLRLIASRVDPKTGIYTGLNNHGDEKVVRLNEEFPGVTVDEFYSDSVSDTPMAKIARKAFWVDGDDVSSWKF